MKSFLSLVALVLCALLIAVGCAEAQKEAICVLKGTFNAPSVQGTVTFSGNVDGSTKISTTVTGLGSMTEHGFHIREYGDIGGLYGENVGLHYNPFQMPHGLPPSPNREVGDLGNLVANAQGIASKFDTNTLVKLSGPYSVIGRSVVVTENKDNGTGTTGFSGGAIAQCVIGIKKVDEPDENFANHNETEKYATCEMSGFDAVRNSTIYGRVLFTAMPDGRVRVNAKVCGLRYNTTHGFHVHTFGDLSGPNITDNVGGHYNPTYQGIHAWPMNPNRHLGDMGNITVNATEIGYLDTSFDLLTLSGPQSIIGRAVVIHANPDNGKGETGNAGTKLAGCVIGAISAPSDFTYITCPSELPGWTGPVLDPAASSPRDDDDDNDDSWFYSDISTGGAGTFRFAHAGAALFFFVLIASLVNSVVAAALL